MYRQRKENETFAIIVCKENKVILASAASWPSRSARALREGVKKNDFFLEKVLNYGWVGVKIPKLVKM